MTYPPLLFCRGGLEEWILDPHYPSANSAGGVGRGAGSDTCKILFDLGNVLGILWLLFDPDNNLSVVVGIPD